MTHSHGSPLCQDAERRRVLDIPAVKAVKQLS
jgi:hypothetical protein